MVLEPVSEGVGFLNKSLRVVLLLTLPNSPIACQLHIIFYQRLGAKFLHT